MNYNATPEGSLREKTTGHKVLKTESVGQMVSMINFLSDLVT